MPIWNHCPRQLASLNRRCLPTILLLASMWMMPACSYEGDHSSSADGDTSVDDADEYELVLVDESAVAEEALPEPIPADEDMMEASPSRVSLPGAVVFAQDGNYTVQIGIHESARDARKRVLELSELGYPAYALAIRGDTRVRVRIGYFTAREDAERFGEIFKEDTGSDYWIDRRANEAP